MFGLMVGSSTAAIFAPMMACVTGWFDTHCSLAVSLVLAGMGMAPMIMSPLAAWLVSNHDWRTSMQVLAVVAAFYAVAALFGFIYAGTMPLYSVLVRENFPLRMMGTVIGETAMAGSLGMATGPVAGGLIYDTFASYAWLYVGSGAVGLGAFLIALTFRPFSRGEAQPVPMPA